VVDPEGKLIAHAGDPTALTFTRSSLKPFQALPLIAHEQVGRFDFSPQEVALVCASHSGEASQVEAVLGILAKIGCSRRDLQCGVQVPLGVQLCGTHPKPVDDYTSAHHNCSGNHAGMLALCRLLDALTPDYLVLYHPVQQAIVAAVAHISEVPADEIVVGIDGCSAPTLALPLRGLALAYARLASCPEDPVYGRALAVIYEAMRSHPEMVSGEGRFDLALSRAGKGRWIAKGGAEGVEGIAIKGRGWGIAVKIADGTPRALHSVVVETLAQLRQLRTPLDPVLSPYARPPILTTHGVEIGEVSPVFRLA
jgi:L-asparaginase II